MTATPTPLETGTGVVKAFVRTLPASPGVYRMLDDKGEAIYVGKARNLKARVTNYTRLDGNPLRIQRMIAATRSMEFVTTGTDAEAMLLEANLIKRLKPRFNVLLRDDKSFPFIFIATDHDAPSIAKHRGVRRRHGHYFGPFASAVSVNRTITALQKAFLIRNCTDSFYAGRTRPCLQFQIKRCAAPCTGEISIPDYNRLVGDAVAFLDGKSKSVQAQLSAEMNRAAEDLDFERAAMLRDRLGALAHIQSQGDVAAPSVAEADIFAIHQQAGRFCVQVFFVRAHQNWGNHAFYPRADRTMQEAEVLAAFIVQFYENRTPPLEILVSHDLDDRNVLAEALSIRAKHSVRVLAPKRGDRRQLVEHALINAREALGRQLSETASQRALLDGFAETFGLEETPRRIEVYDNSHIQGANAVGAMIVAGREGPSKKHYRTFNIKSEALTPGDDFAMMREVLTRRFTRLVAEHDPARSDGIDDPEALPDWPDVLLIDGGKGQLSAVNAVLAGLDMPREVTVIGIAKGEERNAGRESFHIEGRDPFMLAARDPVLYYVQRLRDEAHRFAIGTHRARRKKAISRNPLDDIAGVGPTRKRQLLNHFGSAKAVSRAALPDLEAIAGISTQTARRIYDHFNRD